MSKYVVEYSTGQYDDYRFNVQPLEFEGTHEELEQKFVNAWDAMVSRYGFHLILYKLGIISNSLRTGLSHNFYVDIGSCSFDPHDFRENDKMYPPTIRTLEEWFEEEKGESP